jgi:hypothetical protein
MRAELIHMQIDDLLGMQNANLLNLPENYTFKYCTLNPRTTGTDSSRFVSRSDVA